MTDIDAMADLIVRTIRTRGRQVDVTAESAIRDAMRALVPMIAARAAELQGKALSDKMGRFMRENIDVVPSSVREGKP